MQSTIWFWLRYEALITAAFLYCNGDPFWLYDLESQARALRIKEDRLPLISGVTIRIASALKAISLNFLILLGVTRLSYYLLAEFYISSLNIGSSSRIGICMTICICSSFVNLKISSISPAWTDCFLADPTKVKISIFLFIWQPIFILIYIKLII